MRAFETLFSVLRCVLDSLSFMNGLITWTNIHTHSPSKAQGTLEGKHTSATLHETGCSIYLHSKCTKRRASETKAGTSKIHKSGTSLRVVSEQPTCPLIWLRWCGSGGVACGGGDFGGDPSPHQEMLLATCFPGASLR